MRKRIYFLTALFAFSCVVYCFAECSSANRKLKKPVFIASNDGSKIYDIKATDNYDSIFSYQMDNVGTTLKIFGKNYGKNVSVSTSDGIIVSEKAITDGVTEISIPKGVEYLNVDIKYDEQKHFHFKYPVR